MEDTRNLIIGSSKNVVGTILKRLFNVRIFGRLFTLTYPFHTPQKFNDSPNVRKRILRVRLILNFKFNAIFIKLLDITTIEIWYTQSELSNVHPFYHWILHLYTLYQHFAFPTYLTFYYFKFLCDIG